MAGTAIVRHGFAVLITGASGHGKSDLALRAISSPLLLPGETQAHPFQLLSDDQTVIEQHQGGLVASAPDAVRNMLEIRGFGIAQIPASGAVPLALIAKLTHRPIERMPPYPGAHQQVLQRRIETIELAPFEASAPIKLAFALARAVSHLEQAYRPT